MTRDPCKLSTLAVAIILLLSATGALCQTANQVIVGRIIDGDTFETADGETVRIIGIDALEDDAIAGAYLRDLIGGKAVRLVLGKEKRGKYGRLLAYVELPDGTDIGAKMIQDGQALAYLKYPFERLDEYVQLEITARIAAKGIWAGHFRANRAPPTSDETVTKSKADDDPIVYVTRTGKKYHRVGCRYLKKSKTPMKLSDARQRYGPCGVCKPPR